jgi:hypothetical protein
MRFVQILLALALLALAPNPASAEQRQFGNIIYSPLPGWYAGSDEVGQLNFLSDLPDDLCEFCYIYLTNSRLGRGNLKTFLKREHLRFVDEDDQDDVTVMGEPGVISIAGQDALMLGQKVGTDIQILVAVALDDRFELLGFQGGAYDEADLQTTMSVFQDQVAPFFERITFVSAGAAPLLPKPQQGDLHGVWWGWSTYSTFGLDMMVRQEMDYRTLVFWPDGYFYDGMPPEGLLPIKPDALQAKADPQYGVYEKSGNTLTLTFSTGETETLNAEGDGWADGSKTLTQVEPLADGEKLDGLISSFFFTGFTPGSGLEGGLSSASSTEFFADGTYKGESFGGAFANFDAGGFTTSSEGSTGGTYVVQNGLVISTPSNGGPPTAALALRVDDETILIGDQFLKNDE